MNEEKQSGIIDDYLNADTEPSLRRQRPSMHSRAVIPARREQLIPFQTESKQRAIHQDCIPEWVQKRQRLPTQKPRRLTLVIVICMLVVLFLGLVGFVCFKVFFAVHDVMAFRVGQKKVVSQYIGGGGIIYPRQKVTISYPAPLHIIDVLVKEGDHVTQGQPLIKLDPDQVNAQINRAQDDVNAAQSYLNTVSGSGNSVAIAGAYHALEQAQSKLKAIQAQTSSVLDGHQLVSPIQGVVTNLNASAGLQFATNAALVTIIDQSSVILRAKIPLENLSQVQLEMKALVTPSALPNQTFSGTVAVITPQADAQTDTFQVDVQVVNTQQMLLAGMSAFVRIQGQINAFVVPQLAVLNPDRESSVFVIRNGHAYIKAVHVVERSTNDVYVDDGLTSNDLIVLIPIQRIQQGQEVVVVNTEQ